MSPQAARPFIIAHRGASALAPENTFAAFQKAIEIGVDGIECDVQLTKDGHVVVIHDETLGRTTNGRGRVRNLTLSELRKLDAGIWFNRAHPHQAAPEYVGLKIPMFEEVVKMARASNVNLCVELKPYDRPDRLVRATLDALSEARAIDKVVLASFDHSALKLAKKLAPDLQTAILVEARLLKARRSPADIIKLAKETSTEWISLHYSLAVPPLIAAAKHAGLAIAVWTVDSKVLGRMFARGGIDAIITNRPEKLRAALDE